MFTSILGTDFQHVEQTPSSSPPWVWVGLLFSVAFFVVEVVLMIMTLGAQGTTENARLELAIRLFGLFGIIYWMVCIHRIHKILAEMTHGRYPISPLAAALKHLIPFYNLYWVYHWSGQFSDYLNRRGRVKIIPGSVLGVFLLLVMGVYRLVDGPIGLAAIFGVTMYMSAKLNEHVKKLTGITPDQLPPLPDPRIFSQPIETATSRAHEPVEGSGAR